MTTDSLIDVTDMEARLIGLFVGMFVDQRIPKERLIQLTTPRRLGEIYDLILEKHT